MCDGWVHGDACLGDGFEHGFRMFGGDAQEHAGGAEVAVLVDPEGAGNSISDGAFSPDGARIALASVSNIGSLWLKDGTDFRGRKDEKIKLGRREIYVHYGDGMAASKLVIPAAKTGTARNMNTVATLAKMAAEL